MKKLAERSSSLLPKIDHGSLGSCISQEPFIYVEARDQPLPTPRFTNERHPRFVQLKERLYRQSRPKQPTNRSHVGERTVRRVWQNIKTARLPYSPVGWEPFQIARKSSYPLARLLVKVRDLPSHEDRILDERQRDGKSLSC